MVIFVELKKQLALLGIKPEGQSHFNIKNLMIVLSFAICFFAMGTFILFESKSLIDFSKSFYGTATSGLNVITYSS